MKRYIGDRMEQYVEWTPEDMWVVERYPMCTCVSCLCSTWFSCSGEWMKGSDLKLKPKQVPINELTATQLNRLLPPIYAYRSRDHGQRKRSIITTLPTNNWLFNLLPMYSSQTLKFRADRNNLSIYVQQSSHIFLLLCFHFSLRVTIRRAFFPLSLSLSLSFVRSILFSILE
jgi:hypothetical protein